MVVAGRLGLPVWECVWVRVRCTGYCRISSDGYDDTG
jgi:hypothetical protein